MPPDYFARTDTEKVFIPLKEDTKKPLIKRKNISATDFDTFFLNPNCNTALLTGRINNVIVIDTDIYKKGGRKKWKELLKRTNNNKDFNTLQIATPSDGKHYYFNYTPEFRNNIGLDGYIDILTDGKYAVCPPSKIDNKPYKIIKNTKPIDMPVSLIIELKKFVKQRDDVNNYSIEHGDTEVYIMNDTHLAELKTILWKLPYKCVDETQYWLPIATVLKNINQLDLLDEWSRISKNYGTKYTRKKNEDRIKNTSASFNLGYIYFLAQQNNIMHCKLPAKYIKFIDILNPTAENIVHDSSKFINTQKVIDMIKQYNVLLIKSVTGSGKTDNVTAINNYLITKKLTGSRIISIVSRVTLAYQQYTYFNDPNLSIAEKALKLKKLDLDFVNYDSADNLHNTDQVIVQLDSLLKADDSYDIVILDEFSNIINHLVTSTTLKSKRVNIFDKLITICNNAKKIIALDANLNDNCIDFCNKILTDKKVGIYWNTVQNLNGTTINIFETKEQLKTFENIHKEYIKNRTGFLFFSNEKATIEHYCKYSPDDLKLVYTSDHGNKNELYNTNIWTNMQVYASPSIMYGIDYNKESDVFLYCTNSTLDSDQLIQQLTRCRKIKNAYIYINEAQRHIIFKSTKEVKEYYKSLDNYNKLLDADKEIITDAHEDIIRAHFTNLWAYEKMKRSILISNIKQHLVNNLTARGTAINYELKKEDIEIDLLDDTNMTDKYIAYADSLFQGKAFTIDKRYKPKFDSIFKKFQMLAESEGSKVSIDIFDDTEYQKLLKLCVDDKELLTHFNIRNLIYNKTKLDQKRIQNLKSEFIENIYTGALTKVNMYKQLLQHINNKVEIPGLLENIIKVFKIRQKKININKIKRTIQRDLFGDLFIYIVNWKKINKKPRKVYSDKVNDDILKFHMKVISLCSNKLFNQIDDQYKTLKSSIEELINKSNETEYMFVEDLANQDHNDNEIEDKECPGEDIGKDLDFIIINDTN
jgi:hypothetical protein